MDKVIESKNSTWSRYVPYVGSLLAIPICYLSLQIFLGQQSLAVAGAALGAVIIYVLCKTIQRRGKMSLALVIFVLPLLMAGGCIVLLQLAPFVNQHRLIGLMRSSGMQVNARPPQQLGEWLRNSSGTVLPVWLVKLLGSDCLSEIRSIESELGAFQSIPYKQLDASKVHTVKFKQESRDNHIKPELIDWLNKCSSIDKLDLDFRYFSTEDGKALSNLEGTTYVFVTIRNCESVDGLGLLRKLQWLRLEGSSFPAKLAREIAQRPDIKGLDLEVGQLTMESVAELLGYRGYVRVHGRQSPDVIEALAKIGLNSVQLSSLTSAPLVSVEEVKIMPKTRYLTIDSSQLDMSEIKSLATLFRSETLVLSSVWLKNSVTDQPAPVLDASSTPGFLSFSPEQLESFWELPDLMSIRYFDGESKIFERP